jgi:CheY-like chemotaxis protein
MASKRGLRILVVDHDNYMVEATTAMLERLGYSTQGETESLGALKAFSNQSDKFDLVIVDPMMPGLMGTDLAARFRHIRRDFPVMFYSGYLDPPFARAIETAGLGKTVLRPLGLRELGEAVKEAVHPHPADIQ